MKTIYIERSAAGARDGGWTDKIDVAGVGRIVVGTGPGSFAGVRSALAFALGCSAATGCKVFGLPSPCALAAPDAGRLAVAGDARRGKIWLALFDGAEIVRPVFQTDAADVRSAVPDGYRVVTVDPDRIGDLLRDTFGDAYRGGATPTDEGLRAFAEANPATLVPNPLPVYLNPAVRRD